MGCTWISVVSLTVLIFTFYMENMEATIHSSTKQGGKEKSILTVPTISARKQISTYLKRCQSYINDAEIEWNNVSESSNCTYFEHKRKEAPTSEMNSSDTISTRKQVVTYRDFPEYTKYKTVERVMPYVANILGLITNPLTMIIALKLEPRHTSEIYMFVLGCADLLTVTVRIAYAITERYFETKPGYFCKIIQYFIALGQTYSNMILVSWTIERFIAVMFPIKLASWCSIRNTKITATILLLFCILISVPYITDVIAVDIWNGRTTVNICSYTVFLLAVWTHIESVYYIYIPIILVLICNVTILCRLSSVAKARIGMASNQETIDKKINENRKMTILLLTISVTFLFLHIPYAINLIFHYLYPDITVLLIEDPHAFAKYVLYSLCGYFITEFQNSINFFLYCISGTKFRSTFRKTFCKHNAGTTSGTLKASETRPTSF